MLNHNASGSSAEDALPPIYRRMRVAVLGGGLIGMSWAALFSAYGHPVHLWDIRDDISQRLDDYLRKAHAALGEMGRLSRVPGEVRVVASLEQAVKGAVFVQENVLEDLAIKQGLYRDIAPYLGADTVVASSTSTFQPSRLQEGIPFADRLLVGHPFNPPHLMPVVELVCGEQTQVSAANLAFAFYQSLDQVTLRLRKEVVGHLGNRLQAALWAEAIDAVTSGLASLEDVDAMLTHGLGVRWAVAGPHMSFHLAGGAQGYRHFLDHLGPAFEAQWADLRRPRLDEPTKALLVEKMTEHVAGTSVGALEQARDERLIHLLRSRRACPPLGKKQHHAGDD